MNEGQITIAAKNLIVYAKSLYLAANALLCVAMGLVHVQYLCIHLKDEKEMLLVGEQTRKTVCYGISAEEG